MQPKSFAIMLSNALPPSGAPVFTPVWGLSLIAPKSSAAVHTSYSSKARQPWKLGLGAAANCFTLFNASTLVRCQRSGLAHQSKSTFPLDVLLLHRVRLAVMLCWDWFHLSAFTLTSLQWSERRGEPVSAAANQPQNPLNWWKKKGGICQTRWQLMRFSYASIIDCVFTWLPSRPFP